MMCLKNFLIFLLILPFPSAPPLFMYMFMGAMFLRFKPCSYCAVMLVVVSLATCNLSFTSLSFPEDPNRLPHTRPFPLNNTEILYDLTKASASIGLPGPSSGSLVDELEVEETHPMIDMDEKPINPPSETPTPLLTRAKSTLRLLSSPIQSRCWCDLNYGRLLWPKLEGYRILDWEKQERRERERDERRMEGVRRLREIRRELKDVEVDGVGMEQEREGEEDRDREGTEREVTEKEGEEVVEEIEARLAVAELADKEDGESVIHARPSQQEEQKGSSSGWLGFLLPGRWDWSQGSFLERGTSGEQAARSGSRDRAKSYTSSGHNDVTFQNSHPSLSPSLLDDYLSSPSPSSKPLSSSFKRSLIPTFLLNPLSLLTSTSNQFDLRLRGIGFVIDLGVGGRSEEAVRREVREWRRWDGRGRRGGNGKSAVTEKVGVAADGGKGVRDEL